MKHKVCIANGKSPTPSTLLIPEKMLSLFFEKKKQYKEIANLFHFMVNTRHPVYKRRPQPLTGKISYQPEGMNLQRIDFFPNSEDWERFRTFSYLQRVSMTMLFVMLLLAWDKFEVDRFIVPRIPDKNQLKISLTFHEIFTYLDLEHINV